jgi:hypothetical protein
MVIANHEVKQDRANDGVNEWRGFFVRIRECTQTFQSCGQFGVVGWLMQDGVVSVIDHSDVVTLPEAPGVFSVFERAVRQGAVQFQDALWRNGFMFYLSDPFHRQVVVVDHRFTVVGWLPPGAQHGFSDSSSRRSAFELARCNGFFHQRIDQVRRLMVGQEEIGRGLNLAAGIAVDMMEMDEDGLRRTK